MKVKDGFWLREVGSAHVAVALGEAARNFTGVVNLNGSGAMLFSRLQAGATREQLIRALLDEYETDEATASNALDAFLAPLREADLLTEEESDT